MQSSEWWPKMAYLNAGLKAKKVYEVTMLWKDFGVLPIGKSFMASALGFVRNAEVSVAMKKIKVFPTILALFCSLATRIALE